MNKRIKEWAIASLAVAAIIVPISFVFRDIPENAHESASKPAFLKDLLRTQVAPMEGGGMKIRAATTQGDWNCQIPRDVSVTVRPELLIPMEHCQRVCWRGAAVDKLPQCG